MPKYEQSFTTISDEQFKEETVKRYTKLSNFIRPYLDGYEIIDSFSTYARYKQTGADTPLVSTDIIEDFEGKVDELNVYYCYARREETILNIRSAVNKKLKELI